jgi:uncharacterized membrane protein
MVAANIAAPAPRPTGLFAKIGWSWAHDPKIELWIIWWGMVFFYNLFGVVFFIMTRVMPPPKPWWDTMRVVRWLHDNHAGLLWGFGIIFMVAGLVAASNAIIAYSMRRMSVSRAFAYSYIAIYSLSTLPGLLTTAIALTVAAMRPDRDPQLQMALYDMAIMSFDGTMGVFIIGTLVWMIAILIDKNRVFPKWFGYLNICNAITEFVIAPAWTIKTGALSWNGSIAFWIDTVVFIIYTIAFIMLLRQMIIREDLKDVVLPA